MASSPPGSHKCNTAGPGYIKGGHPSVADGKKTRTVCFDLGGNCNRPTQIKVRNCGSYYVYYLHSIPHDYCALRYCGSD